MSSNYGNHGSVVLPYAKSVNAKPGHFPELKQKYNRKTRGPPGWAIWAGVLGGMVYGFYQIGVTNKHKRMCRKETRESRMALLSYFNAEEDVMMRNLLSDKLNQEKRIMKDVVGWEFNKPLFTSDRWMPPTVGLSTGRYVKELPSEPATFNVP